LTSTAVSDPTRPSSLPLHDALPISVARPATQPLPGYQVAKSLVFAGIYPISGEDYPLLRDAIEKLHLNDASFTYEPESSIALGLDRKSTRLNSSHDQISYAVFCLKK